MKRFLLIPAAVVTAITLLSNCSKDENKESRPPQAVFTANPTTGSLPLIVQFSDQSTNNPSSWLWNFGDGKSSTEQNPSHTYQEEGSFTVELTVSNVDGSDKETKSNYIQVTGNPPVAAFTATPTSGYALLTVGFTDLSTNNPTSWQWDFGDGDISTEQHPVHVYATAGKYSVQLTVTNSSGSDTEEKTDFINVINPAVADLPVNLISYWKMDETTGITASDSHGNNNGLASNERVFTSSAGGKINTGADFTQGNDEIILSGSAILSDKSSWSFSGWIKSAVFSSQGHSIYAETDTTSNNPMLSITTRVGDIEIVHRNAPGDGLNWTPAFSFSDNTWYHIVVVADNGSINVFVNNELKGSASYIFTSPSGINKVSIGRRHRPADYWSDCIIDEVAIWNRALSVEEIDVLYNNGNGLQYPFE